MSQGVSVPGVSVQGVYVLGVNVRGLYVQGSYVLEPSGPQPAFFFFKGGHFLGN